MPSLDATDAQHRGEHADGEETHIAAMEQPGVLPDLKVSFDPADGWLTHFILFATENSSRLLYEWSRTGRVSVLEVKAHGDYTAGTLTGIYVSLRFRRKLAVPRVALGHALPLQWDELYVWYKYTYDEQQGLWVAEMNKTGQWDGLLCSSNSLVTPDGARLARLCRLKPEGRHVEIDFTSEFTGEEQRPEREQLRLRIPVSILR
jgi:hypothetical protein